MNRLSIDRLHLAAGDKTLIQSLDVELQGGQNWAVLGPNGSGKTTLLHCLAGLRTPDAGTVLLNGQSVHELPHRARARQVGIVFQDYENHFPSSVLETVATGRHPHLSGGWFAAETAEDREQVALALARMELESLAPRSLLTLSGGERRRVDLAVLLAQNPAIRLLDEPCNHLDLRHQGQILHQLTREPHDKDTESRLTVVALHDINQALAFFDHGLLLFADGGVMHGPLCEIASRAALEELYQCRLTEWITEDARLYLPDMQKSR